MSWEGEGRTGACAQQQEQQGEQELEEGWSAKRRLLWPPPLSMTTTTARARCYRRRHGVACHFDCGLLGGGNDEMHGKSRRAMMLPGLDTPRPLFWIRKGIFPMTPTTHPPRQSAPPTHRRHQAGPLGWSRVHTSRGSSDLCGPRPVCVGCLRSPTNRSRLKRQRKRGGRDRPAVRTLCVHSD